MWLHGCLISRAVKTAQRVTNLFSNDRTRIEKIGQAAGTISRVHSYLQKKSVLEIPRASMEIGISQPTVTSALKKLEEIGIVKEITGKARDRIYVYKKYLDILGEGTQPL
jgi:Fic family protein